MSNKQPAPIFSLKEPVVALMTAIDFLTAAGTGAVGKDCIEAQPYEDMGELAFVRIAVIEDELKSRPALTHREALAQLLLTLADVRDVSDALEEGGDCSPRALKSAVRCLYSLFDYFGGRGVDFPQAIAEYYAVAERSPMPSAHTMGKLWAKAAAEKNGAA
jgi:hypothetical protein